MRDEIPERHDPQEPALHLSGLSFLLLRQPHSIDQVSTSPAGNGLDMVLRSLGSTLLVLTGVSTSTVC